MADRTLVTLSIHGKLLHSLVDVKEDYGISEEAVDSSEHFHLELQLPRVTVTCTYFVRWLGHPIKCIYMTVLGKVSKCIHKYQASHHRLHSIRGCEEGEEVRREQRWLAGLVVYPGLECAAMGIGLRREDGKWIHSNHTVTISNCRVLLRPL